MDNLILNRYKPIAEAGSGGFGTVIQAWDTRMRRKVAIKKLELTSQITSSKSQNITQILNSEDGQTRVLGESSSNKNRGKSIDEAGEHWEENVPGLSEARTAAMIQDANIVTVHDFEFQDNNAYIIMEYVDGLTLTQFLQKYNNEMTLDMLTCIFNGVSHAIEVAHSKGVLHLDIKPDNVLIDTKGKVKVTDFGLATLADEFGYGTANAGTIGYMPPEQLRRQALDARTDEWSLACLTYEMLCGQNPFNAESIQGALSKIQDAKLTVPSACWEDLGQELDDAIFKALSPLQNDRFDTVSQFAEVVSNHLSSAKAGQKQLTALFKNDIGDMPEQTKLSNKSKILNSLTNNIGLTILGRAFSCLAVLPITIMSTLNISYLGATTPNIFAFIVIFGVFAAAIIWPPLGLTLANATFVAALLFSGNYILAGSILLISILWCVYSFKLKVSNSNTAASFSFFGSFGFSQFSPLACGLFCDIKDSIINTLFGFAVCLSLAALGSNSLIGWDPFNYGIFAHGISSYGDIQNNILKILIEPATWVWLASWILAAALVSGCLRLKQRSLRIIATIAASIILIVGICLANYLTSGNVNWQPQGWQLLSTLSAGVLATIISAILPNREFVTT